MTCSAMRDDLIAKRYGWIHVFACLRVILIRSTRPIKKMFTPASLALPLYFPLLKECMPNVCLVFSVLHTDVRGSED